MDAIKPCLLLYGREKKEKKKEKKPQQPLKFKTHEPEIGSSTQRGWKRKINYLQSIYIFFHKSLYSNGAIAPI